MLYAPILLFVYNRPKLLQKTLLALQRNDLSSQSKLYIFSDGAKGEQDIEQVKAVRKIIHQLNRFKDIEIIESDYNNGLDLSVIEGVTQIIHQDEKVIVLEDDLITAPGFLSKSIIIINKGDSMANASKENKILNRRSIS